MSMDNSEHRSKERGRVANSLLIKNFARSLSRAEGVAIRVRIIKKRARACTQFPATFRARARDVFKRICKWINYLIYQLTTSDTRALVYSVEIYQRNGLCIVHILRSQKCKILAPVSSPLPVHPTFRSFRLKISTFYADNASRSPSTDTENIIWSCTGVRLTSQNNFNNL